MSDTTADAIASVARRSANPNTLMVPSGDGWVPLGTLPRDEVTSAGDYLTGYPTDSLDITLWGNPDSGAVAFVFGPEGVNYHQCNLHDVGSAVLAAHAAARQRLAAL
jgi:hypothetical protein